MEIAVLSGKGGTGKTTVSLNLARAAEKVELLDCDVEEPNSHIFLNPKTPSEERIGVEYPIIDKKKCINCGACGRFCRFNAFISSPSLTISMPELCHSCGGCEMVCPEKAISYDIREIGSILKGTSKNINLSWGLLDVGQLSGVKIIEKLRKAPPTAPLRITDCPPGTSCSTVEAAEGANLAIIVAEPTPFGISDMLMVVEMLQTLKVPMALIINKAGLGDDKLHKLCEERNIPILGEIPFSREAAAIYARGDLLYEASDEFRKTFTDLYAAVTAKIQEGTVWQ
ncbi:MAG: ATP-binding protein [Spirochaetales bacterium]|nr:ATP-binding protein [Spirochaetales bacterium]